MFYRLVVAVIVLFWLVMGTMLIRKELFPDRGSRLPVPVDYVAQTVFRHEMSSELVLYAQKKRLDGTFHFQPRSLPPSSERRNAPENLLSLSGNFLLTLPAATGQRVIFHGELELDDHTQIQRVDLSVGLHDTRQKTPGVTLHFEGSPVDNHWRYQITQGSVKLREGSGTPGELIDTLDLGAYGIDQHIFSRLGSQAATAALTAHRGFLRVNDEDVESFVVTLHLGEGMDAEIYANQLGQILAVKTFLGYDLYDETLAP